MSGCRLCQSWREVAGDREENIAVKEFERKLDIAMARASSYLYGGLHESFGSCSSLCITIFD